MQGSEETSQSLHGKTCEDFYVSETWKGSLHRQQSGEKMRVGVRGQTRLKKPRRGQATLRLRVSPSVLINNATHTGATWWPYTFFSIWRHGPSSPRAAGARRARVNGLNSELTPARRGREAVIHANQPACFHLVQNKVGFCSSVYQRPDKIWLLIHTQEQSLKKNARVYASNTFTGCIKMKPLLNRSDQSREKKLLSLIWWLWSLLYMVQRASYIGSFSHRGKRICLLDEDLAKLSDSSGAILFPSPHHRPQDLRVIWNWPELSKPCRTEPHWADGRLLISNSKIQVSFQHIRKQHWYL